jgi:hypothetical protein
MFSVSIFSQITLITSAFHFGRETAAQYDTKFLNSADAAIMWNVDFGEKMAAL